MLLLSASKICASGCGLPRTRRWTPVALVPDYLGTALRRGAHQHGLAEGSFLVRDDSVSGFSASARHGVEFVRRLIEAQI